MAEIRDYSVTADDNNASSPNGMANGCAPSTVNDTWREGIARMKRWYEDCQGAKTTTGSSNAYLLAASRVVASYAAGDAYMFKATHTNTSAGSTLNVDSVGAKAIVTPTGAAIAAGSITSGGVYLVAYEASADKFMLIGGSHSGGDNPFIYNSSPTLTLENSTSEDTSGGRESQVVFKGLQSGSEESTLGKITVSHDGSSDDQKGKIEIAVNDGSDNDTPTTALTISSNLTVTANGDLTVADDLSLSSDAAVVNFGSDSDVTLTHVADTGVTLSAGTNDTVLQIDSNNADAGSAPKLVLNRTTDSPADNDQIAAWNFRCNNSIGAEWEALRFFVNAKDVTNNSEDSEAKFTVKNNGSDVTGYLSSTGAWTDGSDSAFKTYEGTAHSIYGGTDGKVITDKLKSLNVGRYYTKGIASDKIPTAERHISPTAQDFYNAFGTGTELSGLGGEITKGDGTKETIHASLAPKDIASVGLMAIKELIARIETLETEVAALKE